ncbi:hypothetical protein D3C86_1088530 [compost metagenome]
MATARLPAASFPTIWTSIGAGRPKLRIWLTISAGRNEKLMPGKASGNAASSLSTSALELPAVGFRETRISASPVPMGSAES